MIGWSRGFAFVAASALHGGMLLWAIFHPPVASPPAFHAQHIIHVAMVEEQPPALVQKNQKPETKPTSRPPRLQSTPSKPLRVIKKHTEPSPRPTPVRAKLTHAKSVQQSAHPRLTTPPQRAQTAPVSTTPPLFHAAYLRNPAPTYPSLARRRNAEGKVMLKVIVSAVGTVTSVTIARSSGFSSLDEAARDAVQRWRFIPAQQGNQKIAASVTVPIIFTLKDG